MERRREPPRVRRVQLSARPRAQLLAGGHRSRRDRSRDGFSVDLAALDALLEREVVRRFAHRHLNYADEAFAFGRLVPTCENILAVLWPRLAAGLPPGVTLQRLRLHEDETFFVDYYGESTDPAI